MSKMKLTKNAIKCNHCGDVIESKHVHDFVTCSCGMVSVDGGLEYERRCFTNSRDDFTDLSEYEKKAITTEQVFQLKESYKANKEDLKNLEEYINENCITDYGLCDITESFEQGWNNALEFVFRVLDI